MESTITATHLAKHLSDVPNRVRYRGEEFNIERNGETVARLVPSGSPTGATLADLAKRLAQIEWPDEGYAADVEAMRALMNTPVQPPEWPC
ncbi:MAG TPA: hypothetical protein VK821_09015 [Dehalococcoidia bacterium]|nr:hypothetical protein [Dehalococcoidia bacterium]